MHFYDFEDILSDDMTDFLERFTECEGREDTRPYDLRLSGD